MALINARILAAALASAASPTTAQAEKAQLWAKMIRNDKVRGQNESQIESAFHHQILEGLLGYEPFGGVGQQTYRPKHPMGRGIADVALGHFKDETKIIAPFELKGADTRDLDAPMAGRNKTPVQQAWEYANAVSGPKWVLVSNMLQIRLYAFGEGQQDFEEIDLAKIDQLDELKKAQLLLSAENLLGARLGELLRASKAADKEISNNLYTDYNTLRMKLIDAVNAATAGADKVQAVNTAQKILDRVLFIAFAEDRGLLPEKSLNRAFESQNEFNPQPIWENFKGLFKAIDGGNAKLGISKYNGGLFAFDGHVDDLKLPDEICQEFKKIGDYRFDTEVSITVLGHIFEQSVSDVEKLLARARGEENDEAEKASGVTGRRKRDGIVYTPDYIAKFIVEKTLGTHVEELFRTTIAKFVKGNVEDYASLKFKKGEELRAWYDYRLALKTLRVVDPACGSGVFLVTAFDFLKAEYDRVNKKIAELRGASAQADLEDVDREILSQNLYGVDVNAESVEITKLSLWLKTARKGKELDSLDHNFRVGDSLIEDSNYAYLKHGFSWNSAFPDVFAAGGFDVVLGNPPYVRQELLKDMKPYLQKRFEVYHGAADLYCYFFERGLRLLKSGGRLGFISSSTFFKTSSGAGLRAYLKKEAALDSVTDFGDLQIFEGVTTYPTILTMRKTPAAPTFKFWKVEAIPQGNFGKAFLDNAQDYPQDKLGVGSWELESDALRLLRNKIIAGKKTLKEVYGSPYRGVLTGLNAAFIIDRATRDKLVNDNQSSAEILRPIIKGNELRRWRVERQDNYIIFARRGINIEKYPSVLAYLESFRERLEPRPPNWQPKKPGEEWPGRKPGNYKWYELQDSTDYFKLFEGPKISYIEICSQGPFSYDDTGFYQEATTFMIPGAERHLLALLNSNVIWFYWVASTTVLRGGYQRMKNQYVEPVPIPFCTDEEKARTEELATTCQKIAEFRYRQQLEFTGRIPDLCPPEREAKLSGKLQDWWKLESFAAFRAEVKKCFKVDIPLKERSDWEELFNAMKEEIEKLSAEIKRDEDEINSIVYKLFDLTEQEIALLETSIA